MRTLRTLYCFNRNLCSIIIVCDFKDESYSTKWPEASDVAEVLSRSSIAGNKHLTAMSGMWADFIRLDLAMENITGEFILI